MPVTNYYTVGGELVGESSGGVRMDYRRDALGSVVGTVDASGNPGREYAYKPHGEPLASSGTGADPRFRWVGASGYRAGGLAHATHYVRMRSYGQEEGRWTTVDPLSRVAFQGTPILFAILRVYNYADANPSTIADPSGLITPGTPWTPTPPPQNPAPNPLPGAGCISVSLPLKDFVHHPLIAVLDPKIKIGACLDCFSCACPNPCTASRHLKVTAGVCVDIKTKFTWTDILNLIAPEGDLFKNINDAISALTALVAGGLSCTVPQKGCPDKATNIGAEVCGSTCALNFQASACSGFMFTSPCHGESHWEGYSRVSSRYGNCGWISLSLCIQAFLEQYD